MDQVVDKGSFYGCSQFSKTKCNFTISKKILGKSITQKIVKQLLKDNETEMIEGFSNKDKSFSAKLTWDDHERKLKFIFPNK